MGTQVLDKTATDQAVAEFNAVYLRANKEQKQELVKGVIDGVSPEIAEKALESRIQMTMPGSEAIDRIWQIFVGSLALIAIGAAASLAVGLYIKGDATVTQIMLTVFTTTLAGLTGIFVKGPTDK